MNEITFTSRGVPCAAWHLPAAAGPPCGKTAHRGLKLEPW
jgi:hypothetical protein